jgi:hypothetical protein
MKTRTRWLLLGFIIILSAVSVLLWRDWQKSPSASLYYLGKAIYRHDAALFMQYVDLNAIMANARSSWPHLARLAPEQPDNKMGEILSRLLARPDRPNLPGAMSILLNAVMSRPDKGQVEVALSGAWLHSELSLGFIMRQYPDDRWRVTSLQGQDVEKLLLYCLEVGPN